MKNLPKHIYLNFGDLSGENVKDLDFNDLIIGGVTWSEDRINESDVKYELKQTP